MDNHKDNMNEESVKHILHNLSRTVHIPNELLLAFVADELSEESNASITSHIHVCEECTQALAHAKHLIQSERRVELRSVPRHISNSFTPKLKAKAELVATIHSKKETLVRLIAGAFLPKESASYIQTLVQLIENWNRLFPPGGHDNALGALEAVFESVGSSKGKQCFGLVVKVEEFVNVISESIIERCSKMEDLEPMIRSAVDEAKIVIGDKELCDLPSKELIALSLSTWRSDLFAAKTTTDEQVQSDTTEGKGDFLAESSILQLPQLLLRLPKWLEQLLRALRKPFRSIEEQMTFILHLAELNVKHNTGGPFAAGVFEKESGRLVSPGVDLAVTSNCSFAHAELIAIAMSQQLLGIYNLAGSKKSYELVVSSEPCSMCLEAISLAGFCRLAVGARSEDVLGLGFDLGTKPVGWTASFERRGIDVVTDVCRSEALEIFQRYASRPVAAIYNTKPKDV